MAVFFKEIIGSSPKMKGVFSLIERILDNDSTILVLGESGTGKEMVARAIHYYGDRKDKPLITVNCGAIPEELLESEFFGHEKGAFTGALHTRLGKFEMADNGTIFLDEIGDMSPSLQVKILRVLQDREFDRVGGMKSVKVDVRVIAATNQDLDKAVAEKRFREDLFYRLNVIPIIIPPLRDRKEDIPYLTDYFIKLFNKSKRREIEGITDEANKYLLKYRWPGNVRQLENSIERAVILKRKGKITLEDLPEKITGIQDNTQLPGFDENTVIMDDRPEIATSFQRIEIPDGGLNLKEIMERFENDLIIQALEKSKGVKGRAAGLLGLNRTTLVEKLKKKGIKQGKVYG